LRSRNAIRPMDIVNGLWRISRLYGGYCKRGTALSDSVSNLKPARRRRQNHHGGEFFALFGRPGPAGFGHRYDPQGSIGTVLGLKPAKYLHDFVVYNHLFKDCIVEACPGVDVLCGNRETVKTEGHLMGQVAREFVFNNLFYPGRKGLRRCAD